MATPRDRASSWANAGSVPSHSSGPGVQKRKQPGREDEVGIVEPPQAKKSKVTPASSTSPSKVSHWYYLSKIKETNQYTIALESWDGHLKKPNFKGSWAHQSFASLSPQSQRERLEAVHLFRLSTAQWDRKYFLCIPPERRPQYLPFDPLDASGALLKAIISLVSEKYDVYPSTRSRREQPITWAEQEQAAKAAAEKDLPARPTHGNSQVPVSSASGEDSALSLTPAQASVAPDNVQPLVRVLDTGSISRPEPTSADPILEDQASTQAKASPTLGQNKALPSAQAQASVASNTVPQLAIVVDAGSTNQEKPTSAPPIQEKQTGQLLTPISPADDMPETPPKRSSTCQMELDNLKAQRASLKVKKEKTRAKQVEMQARQAEMSVEQEEMEIARKQMELELELRKQVEGSQEKAGDA